MSEGDYSAPLRFQIVIVSRLLSQLLQHRQRQNIGLPNTSRLEDKNALQGRKVRCPTISYLQEHQPILYQRTYS